MNTPLPIRPQSERSDQTRARILDAAIHQFSENGLAGARTEQIAEAAGVNKALLYYYFQGKDALYTAALESVAQGVRDSSLAVFDADASPGERFLLSALNHFDRIYTHRGFQSLMQQEMVRLHRGETNALTPLAETVFKPLMTRMMQVLREGIASGELIPVDPSQIRLAAFGANVFYFLRADDAAARGRQPPGARRAGVPTQDRNRISGPDGFCRPGARGTRGGPGAGGNAHAQERRHRAPCCARIPHHQD
jgi:TetR/AcrR family transcriptional regulator